MSIRQIASGAGSFAVLADEARIQWPPPPTVSLRHILSRLPGIGFVPPNVQVPDIDPPFQEPCKNPVNPTAPQDLLDSFSPLTYASGTGPIITYTQAEGRLVDWLRTAAQLQNPVEVVKQSAISFFCIGVITRNPPDTVEGATALADLAVSGRMAYNQFQSQLPQDAALWDDVRQRLTALLSIPPDETRMRFFVTQALDRAYNVAWALRDPNPVTRAQSRGALAPAWIAVSAEDDSPDRPVNVASAPFPQFDLEVICQGIAIKTRYIVALPQPNYDSDLPSQPIRQAPGIPEPTIPADHEVILFIHGMDSRAEEAADMLNSPLGPPIPGPLLQAGLQRGRKFAVIAFDLPTNGYSQMIEHTTVAPSGATQYTNWPGDSPATYPLLDFLVEFVISFVNALDQKVPVKNRIAAVIGGSLGGNLSLRLGERNDQPWARNIVAWSPGSVWTSFNHDLIKVVALNTCQSKMNEVEDDATPPSRIRFFYDAFDSPILTVLQLVGAGVIPGSGPEGATQPQQWYRDAWPCKDFYIADDRAERQEIYNSLFRRWHWRVALEQLLFSRYNTDTPDGRPRYVANRTNTFLLAGQDDDFPYANIYPNTKNLAAAMFANTPGDSLFLTATGHSIHNERPLLLSQQIARFVTP